MEILDLIKKEADNFLCLNSNKPIAIFSHYDADGISSAAIMAKALKKLDKRFFVRILNGLDKTTIEKIKEESSNYSCVLFLDLASNFLNELNTFDCPVFIIDHHSLCSLEQKEKMQKEEKIHLINYKLFKEAHEYETSTSVLTYFFSSSLLKDKLNGTALEKIALFGLIGDNMNKELSKLSGLFIKIAKEKNAIQIKRGLNVFSYSKPIHKALEFCSIYIPNITGNNETILEFLRNLGIETKSNNGYRTLNDLSKEEISKLITAIATLRINQSKSLDFIGNIYLVKFFDTIEDAKEITTIINSCGRLEKGYIALDFLLGKKKAKEIADNIYANYKYEIIKALEYINKENHIKEENFIIINGKDKIKDSIIGTVCSMLANSGLYKDGFVIVGLAYRNDGIKVSVRSVNGNNALAILQKIKQESGMDFEFGGHDSAAGAILSITQEETFLKYAEKVLREQSITIKVG